MMMRRSLSTFMNAMTGPDYTLYPFSTTNEQDFKNLLSIYLDAVFKPLLREEDFRQEGHRVEVETDEKGSRRLQNNGVVFNEMRGVVSDPNHHFMKALMSEMLPETHYVHESGGYPPTILDLSYDELKSFHSRHYTPSNSITFTYGDQHPERHMQYLDEYFSTFPETTKVTVPTLPESSRFQSPKVVRREGPLDPMGDPSRQKRISVSYAIPQAANNIEDVVELSVLSSLLGRGPSSQMFKALIEPQIGSKYAPMKGYAFSLSTPILSYGVSGVDESRPNAEEEVCGAVTGALETVKKEGFEEKRVKSVVFQEELQQRHRAADYGLNLCTGLCAMGLCRSCNDPLDFINWLPHLEKISADKGAGLLERIEKDLLQNRHRVTLSVSAKKEYLNQLRDELKKLDNDLNVNVTEEKLDKVQKETEAWLERVRAPQNTDVLPTLKTSDIPRQSFAEPLPTMQSEHLATIGFPTNGLVYVHGIVPFSDSLSKSIATGAITQLSPNFPLVEGIIGQSGAGPYSYKNLFVESELVCGGFNFGSCVNQSYQDSQTSIAGTTFGFYTTKQKLNEALELLKTILLSPAPTPATRRCARKCYPCARWLARG
ncbi:metallo-peptidase, Clan ME, Family M16C [Angomonas deanei]|uniref:Peptidase M16 inactive domain/Peptidase M16C associated, putative n=1 Tax=Angomonas deanei TaxID=59799 RepID=A0A7G2CV43_9TRYP|nr:metallo-peptidase, Clan ME, Family M16C [Angomonas deanei]CAD2222172.1 Peptidase M16 inactive domain/Peptidase M16C associated, putative [Angomonas deanei]|eukprot:EPY31360.1 metallo-peptidase, Clan ME, Family M16C [Angomonas deanei]